ncbi:oligosaccharide flippase family protein [Pseudooceanicola nitratireducens]|uniref:oligosaccharide flippase family protein n=1 Tax=Pseudooceanicola nitratireducens TaxID=517719 RepID=UPI00351974AF
MTTGPKGSLKKRVFSAGAWSVAQLTTNYTFRLASNLVMTRLLVPEAFGIMALISAILAAFTLFSDIGLARSVVRDPDAENPHYLRVAWTVQIVRSLYVMIGVLLSALGVWLLAPELATPGTIYADDRLPGLLVLVSLAPLLQGMSSTNRFLAQRHFKNARLFTTAFCEQLSALAMQITLALIWPTVWALVIGLLTRYMVSGILSHIVFQGPRMGFRWDREIVSRLWKFGKFLMASSTLTFAAVYADRFILASLLGSTGFGLYAIAQIWSEAGKTLVNRLASQVGFPAIGEVIRTRPTEVARLFKRFQRVIDLYCSLAFLAVLFLGGRLINVLYSDAYTEAGSYLRLMSFVLLTSRFETINTLILNLGNSRFMMIVAGIRAIALVILLPLGYSFLGVSGAILAIGLSPLIAFPYTYVLIRPVLGHAYSNWQAVWVLGIFATAVAVYMTQ